MLSTSRLLPTLLRHSPHSRCLPSSAVVALQRQQVRQKGHSKWQNIRHTKASNDLKFNKLSMKYASLIETAVRSNGNQTDPRLNRALAKVIEEAQSQDIRKATIEAAIKRGGNKDGSIDKEILVEIRGPGQCAILAETLVPNRGFLDSKINTVLRKKHGYQDQGIKGMFVRRGVVRIKGSDVDGGPIDMDRAEEIAIECDAEDVEELEMEEEEEGEGSVFEFFCDANHLARVRRELGDVVGAGAVTSAEVRYDPKVTVRLGRKTGEAAVALMDDINEKCPFVVGIHHNIEFARTESSSSS